MNLLAPASSMQSTVGLPSLARPQAAPPHLPSTILLAEDDSDLRYGMDCVLRAAGFVVIACADAELASAAFHSHLPIDALITDYEMPGRTGVDLARELTALCPDLPVVIVTGSILSASVTSEIERRKWMHFNKPCRPSVLQAALTQSIAVTRRRAA